MITNQYKNWMKLLFTMTMPPESKAQIFSFPSILFAFFFFGMKSIADNNYNNK